MADIKVTTKRLLELHRGLAEIEELQPPPTPRGRYALAKAGQQVGRAVDLYNKQIKKLLEEHSRKDDKGRAIKKDLGAGRVKYDLVDPDAYTAVEEEMQQEEVVLSGLREVTLAELGDCPVPVGAVKLLLGVLIEDKEPAAG